MLQSAQPRHGQTRTKRKRTRLGGHHDKLGRADGYYGVGGCYLAPAGRSLLWVQGGRPSQEVRQLVIVGKVTGEPLRNHRRFGDLVVAHQHFP